MSKVCCHCHAGMDRSKAGHSHGGRSISEGRVNEGDLSVLGIELVDSHTLRILSHSTTIQDLSFDSVDFGAALEWQWYWSSDPDGVNGFATLMFKDLAGLWQTVYANRPYESHVVPDTAWLSTSTNAIANFIYLDSLVIIVSEPGSDVLIAISLGVWLLIYGRKQSASSTGKSVCY